MLAGLDKAGVVGLALFPEGLRHPFGFDGPLRGRTTTTGQTIRSPTSKTAAAVFAALGATANDEPPTRPTRRAWSRRIRSNPGNRDGQRHLLSEGERAGRQRRGLRRPRRRATRDPPKAAAQTRDWAIETNPADADGGEAYCEQGGAVVLASAADVAALEQATASVTAELEPTR